MEYSPSPRANLGWLFCGLAVALGWGLRGEFGGSGGATVPGALLGLAIAITSGRPGWVRAAPILGMAGALGFALGGQMSYGVVIGYTKGIDLPNVTYGYAMLGVIGGLWGAFGAGCLGLVASRVKYPVWQVIAFIVAAALLGQGLHWLLIDLFDLRMTPPRGDAWPESLGATLALIAFVCIRRDALPLRLSFWGFAAGSIGFMVGDLLQVVPSFLDPGVNTFNWWKLMEQSFGFILGAGIGWAIERETRSEPDGPPAPYPLSVMGVLACAWLVPVFVFNDMLERMSEMHTEQLERLARHGDESAIALLDGAIDLIAQFQIREVILLALLLAGAFARRHRSGQIIAPDLGAKLLFAFVMWFAVFAADLKMSVPVWRPGTLHVHYGFLLMASALTLTLYFGLPLRTAPTRSPEASPPLRFVAPLYFFVVYPLLAVLLAAVSIATHAGEWRADAHKRFGEEPVSLETPEL